jgi:hypothetical protein
VSLNRSDRAYSRSAANSAAHDGVNPQQGHNYGGKMRARGRPEHNSSMLMLIFISRMRLYFSLGVSAVMPCQGRVPRRKYRST